MTDKSALGFMIEVIDTVLFMHQDTSLASEAGRSMLAGEIARRLAAGSMIDADNLQHFLEWLVDSPTQPVDPSVQGRRREVAMQFVVLFDKIVTRAGYMLIEAKDADEALETFDKLADEGRLEMDSDCIIRNSKQVEYETYWADPLR